MRDRINRSVIAHGPWVPALARRQQDAKEEKAKEEEEELKNGLDFGLRFTDLVGRKEGRNVCPRPRLRHRPSVRPHTSRLRPRPLESSECVILVLRFAQFSDILSLTDGVTLAHRLIEKEEDEEERGRNYFGPEDDGEDGGDGRVSAAASSITSLHARMAWHDRHGMQQQVGVFYGMPGLSLNARKLCIIQTGDMKHRPGNGIEGTMVCNSMGSLLCPRFYFLDDVSYPQSVHPV